MQIIVIFCLFLFQNTKIKDFKYLVENVISTKMSYNSSKEQSQDIFDYIESLKNPETKTQDPEKDPKSDTILAPLPLSNNEKSEEQNSNFAKNSSDNPGTEKTFGYKKNEDTKLSNDLSHNINQEKVENDSLLESDKIFGYEKNEDTKLSNDLSHNINQEKVKNDSLLESDKTFIFEQKPKINKQNQKIKSEKNISSDKNVQEQSDEKKLKDSQRNNLKNQTSNSLKKDKNKQKIEKSSSNKKDKPKIDVSTNQELSLIENTVLEKDLTLFVKNELQMLQIQDDIVLGKVTDQHIIEMMTLEEYTKKFWTEFEYIQNKPKRDSINNFIKNYYK